MYTVPELRRAHFCARVAAATIDLSGTDLDDMDIGRVQVGQLRILQRHHVLRIVRDYNV